MVKVGKNDCVHEGCKYHVLEVKTIRRMAWMAEFVKEVRFIHKGSIGLCCR